MEIFSPLLDATPHPPPEKCNTLGSVKKGQYSIVNLSLVGAMGAVENGLVFHVCSTLTRCHLSCKTVPIRPLVIVFQSQKVIPLFT